MEHHQPEDPTPGKAGTAEAVIPENHELLAGPHEHPQNADARDADGEAGERGQALLRGQCGDNLESPLPEASSAPLGPTLGTLPEVETMRACSMPQELPQSPRTQQPEPDFYCVKWIPWKGERTPIITQSSNGPCPLLAIMNILFLQWKVKLPLQKEVITSDELMAHLGNCLLSIKPQEKSEGLRLNFQQNVDDAITVLPKLATGLDVNVRFTGVSDFEYTPECSVFDLLGIPLYHGWLVDPQQSPEAVRAVGKLSYNQLVEKIITCKHSSDTNLVTEGLIAEQFLETTAAQLTYHGLCELTAAAKEDELSVFFRNNHFSTMTKHKDYLVALSLQQQQPQGALGLTDLELAQQLQQEEYQQQQAVQPVWTRTRALSPQVGCCPGAHTPGFHLMLCRVQNTYYSCTGLFKVSSLRALPLPVPLPWSPFLSSSPYSLSQS
ncbi:ubiquitin carboxyl-terminal hydrolase MINDY-1 isoform X9 [Papio anubis]|uniref:ubiquitin carboxyl-terminal hydrolase MINDY-1 isoform X9 n=1 Tax=Papio anubis TaxID=9555 RepID=UPI0012AE4207|nr:ubiquitin carboxyl-terminal hydrolase MINDY-1 isoform X9 [Papio anubis]